MTRLIQGRFENVTNLPAVDLVIMDPPDNIGKPYKEFVDRVPDITYVAQLRGWLTRARQVTNGPIFLLVNERWIADVEHVLREIEMPPIQRLWWYYSFGQCHRIRYAPCIRPIYWLNNPQVFPEAIRVPSARQEKYGDKRAKPGGKMPANVWEFSRVCGTFKERRKWHSNQIPEGLLERIILGHSKPGNTVLDPFIGSGSSAYVCERTNRKCIGIDVSQTYLDRIEVELRTRRQREKDSAA